MTTVARAKSMAKPDTDDGWFKLSDELFAALCVADFTKRAMVVIRECFEQMFGDAKKSEVYLDPVDIADRSGTIRTSVWKGIAELTASGVLVPLGNYRYRFNKDYSQWTKNGHSRLTGREQDYAREAPGRSHPNRRKACQSGNATLKVVQSKNTDDACQSGNALSKSACQSGNADSETACQSGNARTIEERARGEIRELENREQQAPAAFPAYYKKKPPEWDGLCDRLELVVPGLGNQMRGSWNAEKFAQRIHALWDSHPSEDWLRFAERRKTGIESSGNMLSWFLDVMPKWLKEQGPARKASGAPTQYVQAPAGFRAGKKPKEAS